MLLSIGILEKKDKTANNTKKMSTVTKPPLTPLFNTFVITIFLFKTFTYFCNVNIQINTNYERFIYNLNGNLDRYF